MTDLSPTALQVVANPVSFLQKLGMFPSALTPPAPAPCLRMERLAEKSVQTPLSINAACSNQKLKSLIYFILKSLKCKQHSWSYFCIYFYGCRHYNCCTNSALVAIINVQTHMHIYVQARICTRSLFYLLRNGSVPLSSATDKILIREFENLK